VGPRAGLDAVVKGKIPSPYRKLEICIGALRYSHVHVFCFVDECVHIFCMLNLSAKKFSNRDNFTFLPFCRC
jgi:hypothetical protein